MNQIQSKLSKRWTSMLAQLAFFQPPSLDALYVEVQQEYLLLVEHPQAYLDDTEISCNN